MQIVDKAGLGMGNFRRSLSHFKCWAYWWLMCLLMAPSQAIASSSSSPTANFSNFSATACRLEPQEIITKANLLQAATNGDRQAAIQYEQIVKQHADRLVKCRQANWPATLGVWMRVYPCDLQAGKLEQVLDNAANFGYNHIYLNTFYDGRVLLPANDNPTVWPSVVGNAAPQADLLAQVITKAHKRGIKVHAWLFAMNFGPNYVQRKDRQDAIARNAYGENNLKDPAAVPNEVKANHVFIDPYSKQARTDLRALVKAVALRRPDGILFDYIRYPHKVGTNSIATNVRDLMIYGKSSAQGLLERALTEEGQTLLYQYLTTGKVALNKSINRSTNLWEFPQRFPLPDLAKATLQQELWQLVLAHARLGVIEFLEAVAQPAKQSGIATGAVFFPKANLTFGNGVDARLQPWQEFTNVAEWHAMAYAACGNTDCIIDEINLVVQQNLSDKILCPILMGYWGKNSSDRVALETQIAAVHRAYPQINCVGHFAYSWLNMEQDLERRSCKLTSYSN